MEQCVLVDTNYEGHNVGYRQTKDSWKECAARCNENKACFAWSYYTENYPDVLVQKKCLIKDGTYYQGRKLIKGVLSGVKGCGVGKFVSI